MKKQPNLVFVFPDQYRKHASGRNTGAILYDNTADPYQMTNIADQAPDVVREMDERIRAWLVRTEDRWDEPGERLFGPNRLRSGQARGFPPALIA